MKRTLLAFSGALALALQMAHPAGAQSPHCTGGWEITGYFVPQESDYARDHLTRIGGRPLPTGFVRAVRLEGFGLTNAGDYLGYDGAYHKQPLTSTGLPLSASVDPRVIRYGTQFTIDGQTFVASDTGGAIRGKHIDLFMGYGRAAERAMQSLGKKQVTVCL